MGLIDLLWGGASVAFVGALAAIAMLVPDNLDARADRLQHSDPGTAAALRRARAMSDLARSGGLLLDESLIVCTPTRRDGITLRVFSADEAAPPSVHVRSHAKADAGEARVAQPEADTRARLPLAERASTTRPQKVLATTARRVDSQQKTPRRVPSGR